MESFAAIVNSILPLTFVEKLSLIDVCRSTDDAFDFIWNYTPLLIVFSYIALLANRTEALVSLY